MLHSMTGFGKASIQLPTKKITVEIRSLNSKSLDLSVRLPQQYKEKELEIRNTIANALERGKIELSVFIEITGEETSSKINAPIVKSYIEQMKEILPTADETELMKMAVRMPDSLKVEKQEIDEKERKTLQTLILEAIEALVEFRKQEGQKLAEDLQLRLLNISNGMAEIATFEEDRIQNVKERLQQNLKELESSLDENRFAQELVYYLEKLDINEEKVRLKNHLDYFADTIKNSTSSGRKLGFIAQEIGREINTIGSKSNNYNMQKCVVLMKDELEKIKEQVLNIL